MTEKEFMDIDPAATQEWCDALQSVIEHEGVERAKFLLQTLFDQSYRAGVRAPISAKTPYMNTIPASADEPYPGDQEMERKINSLIRWNAIVMVLRAGKKTSELGGHIASYASAAVLYEVGFNHFFHAATPEHGGDLVYFQGHSSPGIYARAYLEGRFNDGQLDHFRQEIDAEGLTSYPHPYLMPDFWQFPTVSMGLGPIQAIYQARFLKYMGHRGLIKTEGRKVWAFCGDGEMDEPESLGAITIAARERLDNLIFVVNCNLQRLDGLVSGNRKVIQDLEGTFRGAGWHVIKVIWGRNWDPLFAKDKNGLLLKRMEEAVDGDYQNYKAHDGAYVREYFFGKYPELLEMVANMSDEEIWHLTRGGHDLTKVHSAYAEAMRADRPTVVLAKTVKGYGMGAAGEAQNITHQQKKMSPADLRVFRDRFHIPVRDEDIEKIPYCRPDENSPEIQYLKARRAALGGAFPARRAQQSAPLTIPALSAFEGQLQDTGDREISTTMAFVRILNTLMKDKELGPRIVPIIPDECRTFGMEGMFRQYGIYSVVGQLYTPQDKDQVMFYKESQDGQVLEEGLTEAGGFSSWIAAGTSYSNNDYPMIPFFIYYSMFGFQRVGDLAWAAGDCQTKGFLLGGTAGRTTLAGEGLQHQDGHTHLFSATIPNCRSYDPTFSYELAVIIQDGLRRMYADDEKIYYYITVMNENYHHPAMPKGAEEGIIKGMYLFKAADKKAKLKVQLMGSGTILREVIKAAEMLEKDYGVGADIWSVTSFTELRREGLAVERHNRQHPEKKQKQTYVEMCLKDREGPVIAATDYIRAFSDQIRAFVPGHYVTLGTDGFGRSDTRKQLRHFFEVDAPYVAYTALKALFDEGKLPLEKLLDARKKLGVSPTKPDPVVS